MLCICSLFYILGSFTVENETRCYEELGCLNVTREWYHLIYRPFNVFPLPRQVIDTRFVLYTRKNPTEVSNILCHKALVLHWIYSLRILLCPFFNTIYSIHIVTCVTMDMSNSVAIQIKTLKHKLSLQSTSRL